MKSQKLRTVLDDVRHHLGDHRHRPSPGIRVGLGRQMRKNMHGMGGGSDDHLAREDEFVLSGAGQGKGSPVPRGGRGLSEIADPAHLGNQPGILPARRRAQQGKNTYLASVRGVYPVYAAMRQRDPPDGRPFSWTTRTSI